MRELIAALVPNCIHDSFSLAENLLLSLFCTVLPIPQLSSRLLLLLLLSFLDSLFPLGTSLFSSGSFSSLFNMITPPVKDSFSFFLSLIGGAYQRKLDDFLYQEDILPPKELIQQYQEKRDNLNADIDRILAQVTDILGINLTKADSK